MTTRLALLSLLLLAPSPLAAQTLPAPRTKELYLQLIRQARADGRPRAALAYLDDFDRRHPGDVNAHVLRVNSLLDLGQVDQAEQALAGLAKVNNNAAVHAARGHVMAARDRWYDAVVHYHAAVAGNPADPMLRNALGYAHLRAGQGDLAIEQLRGAADLAPGDTVIRNNLLLAYAVTGRKQELITALRRVGDQRVQAELLRKIDGEARRLAPAKDSPKTGARP